jgi:hypothetical protein
MPISWNEIRQNAIRFSREWAEEHREDAEAKTFWDEFFAAFGMRRRTLATFEEPVRRLSGTYGFIDLFWRGVLLVEHKSRGADLDKATSQAFRYLQDLARENRPNDLPRYVILSDFQRVALYDLEPDDQLDLPLFEARHFRKIEFPLTELHKHIQEFAFIAGYKQHRTRDADPINIKAVEILGDLHDALAAGGYSGHDLERFLVRILFCLFAEDTGLFEPETFTLYLENRTVRDGSDLGLHLARLFEVLDTPSEHRQQNLDELLAAFPYVNGALFSERLAFADFNRAMRDALLACTRFDWSRISPAIFGSLFQGVMDARERRQSGGHYTSETDILKVINALFMDSLREEFAKARRSKAMLKQFHAKLGRLRFLDPACGCGNFLVITYRELRLLEIEVLQALHGGQVQLQLNVHELSIVDVDSLYGIEIQEWPTRIAEVAMWLMDHQMNTRLSEAFGQYFVRLPLRKSAHVTLGNALRLDWSTLLPPDQCSYVLGNPPFVGKKEQDAIQKADMVHIWGALKGSGNLDYVTCWYRKAADYIRDAGIQCAFVSTNSITQGEQVGVLWSELFNRRIKIHFAHRTFQWQSEARGKAHVHVVIIGFAAFDTPSKSIYEYHDLKGNPTVVAVSNINPYLLPGGDTTVRTHTTPINGAPPISYGSMMIDKDRENGEDSGLILNRESRNALLAECPDLKPFIRELVGGEEFLNGTVRWCLWLADAPPQLLRASPLLRARIETVRAFRAASKRPQTRKLAATPCLFGEIRQPDSRYLLIPKVSSESRRYIPIGFLSPRIIASGSALIVPGATKYDFGILSSNMHNVWMRTVAGRLESRFQYSNNIVYNNFPWPQFEEAEDPAKRWKKAQSVRETHIDFFMPLSDDSGSKTSSRKTVKSTGGTAPDNPKVVAVQVAAQAVLDVRAKHPLSTLADLYDPLTMPADLVKAHAALDRAVDRCYQKQPFTSDTQRLELLFSLYERYTTPLLPATEPQSRPVMRRNSV